MAFEIMALIIDQTFQHGIHKCNTLITLGVSCGVEKKMLNRFKPLLYTQQVVPA